MQKPKISVCIPTYNNAQYISQAIESVLNQTFTDYELLVVNNSSSDSTEEVIRGYEVQDARIRYICHETNLGMVGNWNFCLREAQGEFIKFLFGDDFFTSNQILSKMLNILESNETISLVSSARTIVDEDSIQTDTWKYCDTDIMANGFDVINTCLLSNLNLIGEPTAAMFRKSQSERGFDPAYKQLVDLEMWFFLLEQGKYVFLNEPMCAFRIHKEQQTAINATNNVSLLDTYNIFDTYFGKSYINISWFNKKYLRYDYTYHTWKSYFKKTNNKANAFTIIEYYGFLRFYSLLPLYKIYKPIVKLLTYTKLFVKYLTRKL